MANRTVTLLAAALAGALDRRAGAGRRNFARRQGGARGVLVHAARHRHPQGLLQKQRPRRRRLSLCRRRQAAAGDGVGLHRHRARLRTGLGLHRQRLADQGRRRHGGAAAAPRHRGAAGRRQERRRTEGQEDQRLDRGRADLLAGQRNLAPPGLGPARHRHPADGRHGAATRRPQARRHRRHRHGHQQCVRSGKDRRRAHPGALQRLDRISSSTSSTRPTN